MVWIFTPESFEACRGCGAKNLGELRVVDVIQAKTDSLGRMKVHMPGRVAAPPVDLTGLNLEDDLV
jgi:hypothetical protein